jgi:SNF2 family DNA or RNA helicase
MDMHMGTGKSAVIIWYIVNNPVFRTLIVCPKGVMGVWPYQAEQHAVEPLEMHCLDQKSVADKALHAKTCLQTYAPPYEKLILVVNYESAWRKPLGDLLLQQKWDLVVLDESHKIKAPGGKASRYMARLRDSARTRVCLSGTPLAHSPLDIYGQYRFLDPSIFGTNFSRMKQQYAVMGGFQNYQVISYKNQEEMGERIDRIRFHASGDVLDLPPVVSTTIPVTLPPAAMRIYDDLEKEFYAQVDAGEISVSNALVKILRLQQISSGHIKLDDHDSVKELHTAKQDALEDYLSGLPADEPVVVFCRFRHDMDQSHRAAANTGRASLEVSGRQRQLEQWQAGEAPILVVQIGAGAEGIDLTRAHYCAFFSFTHSLGQWAQAHARVHRPGQTETVFNAYIIVRGSIDGTILTALKSKRDVIESVLGQKTKEQETWLRAKALSR